VGRNSMLDNTPVQQGSVNIIRNWKPTRPVELLHNSSTPSYK